MKKMVFAALLMALAASSCKKDEEKGSPGTVVKKGAEVVVGSGKAWTWVESARDNKPLKVGIRISDSALPEDHGLNAQHDTGGPDVLVYHLELPENKVTTLFDHVTIDWNPHGHPPAMVYDKAHFDFHFYMDTKSEIDKIPEYQVDSTKFKNFPSPGYLPAAYFPTLPGSAKMGVHWIDSNAPELTPNGGFTQTFIYGSYNGKVNFYEPMATRDFLKGLVTSKTFERTIPHPEKFAKDGYYPRKITYNKVDGGYEVVLSDFIYRQKS